jgi:signal transduction histidine kinase
MDKQDGEMTGNGAQFPPGDPRAAERLGSDTASRGTRERRRTGRGRREDDSAAAERAQCLDLLTGLVHRGFAFGHESAEIDRLAGHIADCLGLSRCQISLWQPEVLGATTPWRIWSSTADTGSGAEPVLHNPVAHCALAFSQDIVSPDFIHERRFDATPLVRELGIRSGFSLLIPSSSEWMLGTLDGFGAAPRTYSDGVTEALTGCAEVIAQVIERGRLAQGLPCSLKSSAPAASRPGAAVGMVPDDSDGDCSTRDRCADTWAARLVGVQEEERKRIARELHDVVGQTLTSVKYRVERAVQALDVRPGEDPRDLLEKTVCLAQQGLDEVRRISMELRPSILDDLGIRATITWHCREFQLTHPGIRVGASMDRGVDDAPDSVKLAIFRILQEALTNVARHSEASSVDVYLRRRDSAIVLLVADDGKGLEPSFDGPRKRQRSGFGLCNMRERAAISGGSLWLDSLPGAGTLVRGEWPFAVPSGSASV